MLVIFISFYQSQLVRNSLSREVLPTPHSFGYESKQPFPHCLSPFLISLVEGPVALPFQNSQGPHQLHGGYSPGNILVPSISRGVCGGVIDCEEAQVCGEQTRGVPQT